MSQPWSPWTTIRTSALYPRCKSLALDVLAHNPRAKNLALHDFRIHVEGLAEELLMTIENYSLPKDDRDE